MEIEKKNEASVVLLKSKGLIDDRQEELKK